MKKRERTLNLVTEAEVLENQNVDLKTQVRNLEIERRTLTEMLQSHGASCVRPEGFQPPVCGISVAKYLSDAALGSSQAIAGHDVSSGKPTCDQTKSRGSSSKTSQSKLEKIPPMNTLKFSCRRSQQHHHSALSMDTIPVINSITRTTTTHCIQTPINTPNIECKPLPSMDLGYCEGAVEMLTPTSGYCKSVMGTNGDCYAISSPDSGFIKSPADISGYTNIPLKTDYIPNCESTTTNLEQASQLGLGHSLNDGPDSNSGEIEFILKSELVDGNDSPYTTVQSADRFLFDGQAEAFDPDMDAPTSNSNHLPIIHPALIHSHAELQHTNLKLHHNNNNLNHVNNNITTTVIPATGMNSIIEFNNSCQPFIDGSLLKSDFLNQNGEFLTLANDGCDTQFTDLDSGVTTYTSMTNGSGCLA